MPPKKPATKATPKRSQKDAELIKLLTQQSSVLTSIATALVPPQQPPQGPSGSNPTAATFSQPGTTTAGPYPLPTIKSIPLPKLNSPEEVSIPAFQDWKQRWGDYYKANQLHLQALDTQQGVLRSALHPDWTMLWSSERIQIRNVTSIPDAVSLLEGYLRTKRNPLLDRQEFIRRDQHPGESIDRYYSALRALDDASSHDVDLQCVTCRNVCESYCPTCHITINISGQLQQLRIRDRLICGLVDLDMQRKVLAEQYSNNLTLEKVLNLCVAIESSKETGSVLTSGSSQPMESLAVSSRRSTYKKQPQPREPAKVPSEKCSGCGRNADHDRPACPAFKTQCHNCRSFGHYSSVCRKPRMDPFPLNQYQAGSCFPPGPPHPTVLYQQPAHPPPPPSQTQHSGLSMPPRRNRTLVIANTEVEKLLEIKTWINNTCSTIKWLPDTGSDVNAMGENDFRKLGDHVLDVLQPTIIDVVAANGESLGPVGSFSALLCLGNRTYRTTIGVYKKITSPLLSKEGCIALGLIDPNWPYSCTQSTARDICVITPATTVMDAPEVTSHPSSDQVRRALLHDFSAAFDDVNFRAMAGPPMSIKLIPGAQPCKRYQAYTVPLHWREAVKSQLDNMVGKGVIEVVPVGEALEWCHPMVVVPKKGSNEPRITIDLTGLNKFVCRPAYPTKVPREEIASVPPGMRYFTKLDARWGYWQVPLDDDSKKLTSFITPWGSYRFRRNVMGLVSAGDEHNRRGDEALKGITNVKKVVEDILIYDEDWSTHVERVKHVLQQCQHHGITLNAKKFEFGQSEVEWCGFVVNSAGYKPAAHLLSALRNFPVPKNKTDVRSFCGLVQQFETFSHRITELSSPIRSLLSASAAFVWEETHQRAFQNLIDELCSTRVLAQFDPGKPLRLETDAAQSKGLGYALYQQTSDGVWRLLQVGSRFVTPTESRYSASEIELLAVVWAARKCRLYLLGSPFELIVDHRPLIPIINTKTLDQIDSPRLRRLKEKLAAYQINAIWRAGTKHTVVDVFSRHPVAEPGEDDFQLDADEGVPALLAAVESPVEHKDIILEGIHIAASQCSEYQRLLR